MPTTALFFNVPGHGHVNPSLPLVAELTRRGHQITYVITPKFRASVEAVGATFHPYATIADDYFEANDLHGGVPSRVAHALITTAEAILPELLALARAVQPDYILFDGMCPWGYLVARILRLPAVASLALMPLSTPPPRTMIAMLPMLLPLVFRDFGKGLAANRQARALTTAHQLPPFSLTGIMNNVGDLSISYTSSYFQPDAATVHPSVRHIGWTLNDAPPPSTWDFIPDPDKPLVYVSLGTLNNDDPGFFRACIEAFSNPAFSGYQVILSTGNRLSPASFGTLPPYISVHGWVPQIAVLRRASLFVTHGGMNSIHDGLFLGVPLLVVPQQFEQAMNARRVATLGAGLVLDKAQISAAAIRREALRLLMEPSFRAEAVRVGETLRAAGGLARAADEIEALLRLT